MRAALASSMMGFDGDCTAATVCGLYGIMKGYHPTETEYDKKINEALYQDGKGIYHNDNKTGFDPYIGANYPEDQKISDIIKLYQHNFENILRANGGYIDGENYMIQVQNIRVGKLIFQKNWNLILK